MILSVLMLTHCDNVFLSNAFLFMPRKSSRVMTLVITRECMTELMQGMKTCELLFSPLKSLLVGSSWNDLIACLQNIGMCPSPDGL